MKTVIFLRLFPPWTHPLLSRLLPFYWHCWSYVRLAKSLLGPAARTFLLQDQGNTNNQTSDYSKPSNDCILSWFASAAKGPDRDPERLAHLTLLMAMASVHTTLVRITSVLYDLIAHPQLIEEIRAEIAALSRNDKPADDVHWSQAAYPQLHKLDSVLLESQRLNPPAVLGVRRFFSESHTFSNGVFVPKGTYVCLPTFNIENDPTLVQNPEEFDGLRSYRLRQRNRDDAEGHVPKDAFTSINHSNLGFGYGKGACPGRYFASLMLKVLFVKLLSEYEFRFLPGKGRPANGSFHELVFPPPHEKVLVRKREVGSCPF